MAWLLPLLAQTALNERQSYSLTAKVCVLYREIVTEKEFLDLTTSEDRCIVHFYHTDFRRCAIMHTHLEVSALFYHNNADCFILAQIFIMSVIVIIIIIFFFCLSFSFVSNGSD